MDIDYCKVTYKAMRCKLKSQVSSYLLSHRCLIHTALCSLYRVHSAPRSHTSESPRRSPQSAVRITQRACSTSRHPCISLACCSHQPHHLAHTGHTRGNTQTQPFVFHHMRLHAHRSPAHLHASACWAMVCARYQQAVSCSQQSHVVLKRVAIPLSPWPSWRVAALGGHS